jgi:hypothetical protein
MLPTIAMSSAGVFVLLLSSLHVVRADLDPSWHMISEYGVGASGWMMTAAFLALASAFFTLMLSLRPIARGWLGVAGLVLLLMASLGAAMGGLFPMDPAGTPHEQISRSGALHGVSFMLGVPSTLLGVTFINARLWRDVRWHSARVMLLSTAGLVWLTLAVFAISMVTYIGRGAIGPQFLVGWQNRALVLAWALWIVALSWRVRTAARSDAHPEPT